jgi:hypothetical protein
MRKHLIIFFLTEALLLIAFDGITQNTLNFKKSDSITYSYYSRGEWDEVIKAGKKSLDSGNDYFYLRMRMGWAFYSKQNYRLAAKQYEKALEFNSHNPDAIRMLMVCYDYGNRKTDAFKLLTKPRALQNPDFKKRYGSIIKDLSFFHTYSRSASLSIIENYLPDYSDYQDGIQKISYQYYYPQINFSHKLFSNSIILEHQAGYLGRKEFSYFVTNLYEIVNNDQYLHQYDYSLSIHITPFIGFKVSPGVFFSNIRIPIYVKTANDYQNNNEPTDYITGSSNFVFLKLHKDFGYVSTAISTGIGKINALNTQQTTLHLKIYPFANMNLYYALNASTQKKLALEDSKRNFIHQHKLGVRITDNLWLEAETTPSEVNSFYDLDANIMYNGLETNNSSYGIRCIIPINNTGLQFLAGLVYTKTESGFIPDAAPHSTTNPLVYPTLNITGGFTWKF